MTDAEQQELLAVLALAEPAPIDAPARLRALEDKAAIHERIVEYGLLCDARDWDSLLDRYTDDIERTLAGTLTEHVVGKPALRAKLEAPTLQRSTSGAKPAPAPDALLALQFRHLMANEVIRLQGDGDEAVAAVQYSLVATRDDGRQPERGVHEGSYIFGFRRCEGSWLFRSQRIFSDNARNPMFQRA